MRVFYGSFLQETNSFCPLTTDMETLRRGYYYSGKEIAENLQNTNTEIAGFIAYCEEHGIELFPGVACWAVASGKVQSGAFEEVLTNLCASLKSSLPVDGVLLALHGAMVAEGIDDCEGEIISRIRGIAGKAVPVAVSLDYHANITEKMVSVSDIMIGYRTYPHVDFEETGYKTAKALHEMLISGERPQKLMKKLPLIVPVENSETVSGVSGRVTGMLEKMEEEPSLMSASLFCPQPWLDIEEAGVALLFYLNEGGDAQGWKIKMDGVGRYILDNKERYFGDYPSVEDAIRELPQTAKPVIFVDSGDITTAGSIGDSTVILRAMLDKPYKVALSIVSKRAVEQAFAAGEGAQADISIGGDTDYGYNTAVTVHGRVVSIKDKPSEITGRPFSGIKANSGRRAYIKVGENLNIVAAEYATLMYDPQFLRDMGVEPNDMDVIMQKSHKLFRAAYKDIAKEIKILDTPGFTDMNLRRLAFKRISRPIYPLDNIE